MSVKVCKEQVKGDKRAGNNRAENRLPLYGETVYLGKTIQEERKI